MVLTECPIIALALGVIKHLVVLLKQLLVILTFIALLRGPRGNCHSFISCACFNSKLRGTLFLVVWLKVKHAGDRV